MARTSLREKHRQRRTTQMLDAALTLFTEQGYEATRIEEIAETASVAPATVYNYFFTKPNLLMELALRHVHAALPERRALIENLPEDPIKGINTFEKLLAEQAMRHLSRECWRIILSAQFLEPGGRAHRTGIRLNLLIKRQYVGLLRTYQLRGRLQPWIDVASLSELIVGITTWNFAKCVSSASMTIPQLLGIGVTQTQLIMSGLILPARPKGSREADLD